MALFTDGPAVTIDDLTNEDSGVLATAETVGINLTVKLGLAMAEVQSELESWLLRPQPASGGGLPGLSGWTQVPRLGQVVVTPELARWEKMQTLTMVYRDAYFSQLVDRYQGKWDEYSKLTRYARDQFVASGVGLVTDPMPKAATPVLGTMAGATGQAGGTFYTSITWVNAEGQEGASSNAGSITVTTGNLMTVMATGAPPRSIGFNVYVGTAPAMITLQTSSALPADVAFTYTPGMSASNQVAGVGQAPDYVKPLPRTMLRG